VVGFAAGSVVLVPFPFSDLSQAKLRPAVVLANAGRDDRILCQITSNPYGDPDAIRMTDDEFASGSLRRISFARPGKLFTANDNLIVSRIGTLNHAAFERIIESVITILRKSLTISG
jgi:mRNA interferase MazF